MSKKSHKLKEGVYHTLKRCYFFNKDLLLKEYLFYKFITRRESSNRSLPQKLLTNELYVRAFILKKIYQLMTNRAIEGLVYHWHRYEINELKQWIVISHFVISLSTIHWCWIIALLLAYTHVVRVCRITFLSHVLWDLQF